MRSLSLDQIETPAVVIDMDTVDRNISRAQDYFDKINVRFRPHVKTHKIVDLAKRQLAAGATGIACQKISEAEVFAQGGCDDILICYNIIGEAKLARLRRLAERASVTVVADNEVVIEQLSAAFASSNVALNVLVECDTGLDRCGVQTPSEALELALAIEKSGGLNFHGLMTYPAPGQHARVGRFLAEAKRLCLERIGACPVISSGGTPSLSQAHLVTEINEYRAGTYIYNDRSLVERGASSYADCALRVLTRVVSRPTPERAIVDAGSKTLSSDLLGLAGYGHVVGYPGATIKALSEEHGHIVLDRGFAKPAVGEFLWIVPNHACPVSNLAESVLFVKGGYELTRMSVDARACVS